MIIRGMIKSLGVGDCGGVGEIAYATIEASIAAFCGSKAADYLKSVTYFKNGTAYLYEESIDEVYNTILDLAKV